MPSKVQYNRFMALKALIENGIVKSYRHIFLNKYLTAGDMRQITGHNHYAVQKLVKDPLFLSVADMVKMADAIGVGIDHITAIVLADVKDRIPKKKSPGRHQGPFPKH